MRNLLERALAFSILSAVLIAPVGAAERQEGETPLAALNKVTVTATKTPIKIEEVPASVSITTSEDIQARATSTDAYKAIGHMAGVEPVGGNLSDVIYIRGKVPSILSHGRDMNFFSGILQDSSVSMSSIERIEVLKGPQAAIHGAKATSGVVNIIRKKGDINHPFIEMGVYAGTGKDRGTNLTLGGGVRLENAFGGGRAS